MIRRRQASVDAEAARIAAMSPEERAAMEADRVARRQMDDAIYELKKNIPWLECGEEPFVKISAAGSSAQLSVGRSFEIKDALKAEGYTFDGFGKMWVKTFTDLEKALAEIKRLKALNVKLVK